MTVKIIGTLLTVILLISCDIKKSSDQNEVTSDKSKIANTERSKSITLDSTKTGDDLDYSDCNRGQAESVTKKTVYPNAIFKLNSDNHTGTETVDLENGEKLIINNWGCEYYALTFRFETDRFQADTTNINYWIDKGLLLMREIKKGLDAPLDIEGGEVALKNYLKQNKEYKLGEWIDYGNETIPTTLTIDRIQKLADKRFAIELTYSVGPL